MVTTDIPTEKLSAMYASAQDNKTVGRDAKDNETVTSVDPEFIENPCLQVCFFSYIIYTRQISLFYSLS